MPVNASLNSSGMKVDVGWPACSVAAAARREAGGRAEASLEPAPREAVGVQLVADVGAAQRDRVAGRAVVVVRLGIAGEREPALAVGRDVRVRGGRGGDRRARSLVRRVHAARVTGDQVDRTRCRGAERRPERVVAHRVVLRVVPQRRRRVPVVVVHHGRRGAGLRAVRGLPARLSDRLHEEVHQAAVERLLLVAVVVILVAGLEAAGVTGEPVRAAVEPQGRVGVRVCERRGQIRAVPERGRDRRVRRGREPGDGRCAGPGRERLAVTTRRVRIRAEVVVEGDVLLEDHDDVLDRRGRRVGVGLLLDLAWGPAWWRRSGDTGGENRRRAECGHDEQAEHCARTRHRNLLLNRHEVQPGAIHP